MKPKIIFWLDRGLVEFGVAKTISEKINCDLYGIFEVTSNPKQFFQNQKIVSFEKKWFYFDHILKSKKKPDLKYLKSIEEKYKINLWLLAFNDRIFYNYNEYYKFTTDEILCIIEQECRLFESILDKISLDYFITHDTYSQPHRLFYEMCRAKGIKILLMSPVRFGERWYISDETDKFESLENIHEENLDATLKPLEFLSKSKTEWVKDMALKIENSKKDYAKAALNFLFSDNSNLQTHYTYYGRTKISVFFKMLFYEIRKKCRNNFMNKNLDKEFSEDVPFIYFPLHQEQESMLLIGAPFHLNQIDIIKNVAKSLPVGYKLVVKDHSVMNTRGWRSISECKEIMNLPNVILVNPYSDGEKLLKKCSLVISIKGSASIEAAFYMKPSILFRKTGLYKLPSMYKLKAIEELPNAIRKSLEIKVESKDLIKYANLLEKNSFIFHLTKLNLAVLERFNFGGYSADGIFPDATNEMQGFLSDFKSEFDFLAEVYLKKIKADSL